MYFTMNLSFCCYLPRLALPIKASVSVPAGTPKGTCMALDTFVLL